MALIDRACAAIVKISVASFALLLGFYTHAQVTRTSPTVDESDLTEHKNHIQHVVYTTISNSSVIQQYYVDLLERALLNTVDDFGPFTLNSFAVPMNQERQIKTLLSEDADVMWTMTTPAREAAVLAVKEPLLDGLLGKRVFFVGREQVNALKGLDTAALKRKTAVQGRAWPDTAILQHNGFKVSTIEWYDWQFGVAKLLTSQTVDYFPRGVVEAHAELALPHNAELVIDPYHLLEYKTFIYFFVAPSNTALHERLSDGLRRMKASGEFSRMLASYPGYLTAQQLLKENRTRHQLENPFFATATEQPSQP
ncbi:transporter substrate-binding domain-containing protein [Alteromonas oceanisediminis]|uniref:transporter substrate-binding domain-containing protein n=1 Tax=Alteromonas oceanisediminis TaxID=2836180 RepID=UPI001BD98AFF|nr:transporter substrate-binding domain-containing protein [Alteromonas oceanisediminis]MBT0585213.1 transporter substrate-binding domain-containing protein [Alteromonas oceanisediminis]